LPPTPSTSRLANAALPSASPPTSRSQGRSITPWRNGRSVYCRNAVRCSLSVRPPHKPPKGASSASLAPQGQAEYVKRFRCDPTLPTIRENHAFVDLRPCHMTRPMVCVETHSLQSRAILVNKCNPS